MKCPRDGTKLAEVEILGMQLDKCHQCDGIWFDRGELKKIQEADVPSLEEALEEKYGDPEYEEGEVDGYMRCPRCGNRLQEQRYTYKNGVRIDRCEECFGFWVDDMELDRIVGEKQELKREVSGARAFLQAIYQKMAGS
jgi:hypothetical protein